jgi:hypothetical protein
MASGLRSLPLLLFVTAACAQVIGLGSYEKTDADDGANGGAAADGGTGDPSEGGTHDTGGTHDGGANPQGGTGNRPSGGNGGTTNGGTLAVGGDGGSTDAGAGPISGGAGSGGAPIVTGGAGGTEAGGAAGSGGGRGDECADPVQEELLVDGSFDVYDNEDEENPWLQTTTNNYYILGDEDDNAVVLTQPRSAWLGGFDATVTEETGDYYIAIIWQEVTIPPRTVRLSAQCQVLMQTDVNDNEVHALLEFMLQDSDTFEQLTLFEDVDNNATENVWFPIGWDLELPELERLDLLDRTVTVALASFNDDIDDANFFVDNCSVVATICP